MLKLHAKNKVRQVRKFMNFASEFVTASRLSSLILPTKENHTKSMRIFHKRPRNHLFLCSKTYLSNSIHTSSPRLRQAKKRPQMERRLWNADGLRVAVEGCVSLFGFIACSKSLIINLGPWNTRRNLRLSPRGSQSEGMESP